jgi:hypothetical protein
VAEHLPSKCKALNLNSRTKEKKKNQNQTKTKQKEGVMRDWPKSQSWSVLVLELKPKTFDNGGGHLSFLTLYISFIDKLFISPL